MMGMMKIIEHDEFWNAMNGIFDKFVKIGLPSLGITAILFVLWRCGAIMPILKFLRTIFLKCCCPRTNSKIKKYENKEKRELQKRKKQLESIIEQQEEQLKLLEIQKKVMTKEIKPSTSKLITTEVQSNVGGVTPSK